MTSTQPSGLASLRRTARAHMRRWAVSAATVGVALIVFGPASAVADDGSRALIDKTTAELFSALRRSPGRAESLFLEIVSPHMDFDRISRRVLGKHWPGMSPEQRSRFLESYRSLIARSYAGAIAKHLDARIEHLPTKNPPEPGKAMVRTLVTPKGGSPALHVDYRLAQTGTQWKVFDIVVEGVSLVTSFRVDFVSEIDKNGVDRFLDNLAKSGSTAPG